MQNLICTIKYFDFKVFSNCPSALKICSLLPLPPIPTLNRSFLFLIAAESHPSKRVHRSCVHYDDWSGRLKWAFIVRDRSNIPSVSWSEEGQEETQRAPASFGKNVCVTWCSSLCCMCAHSSSRNRYVQSRGCSEWLQCVGTVSGCSRQQWVATVHENSEWLATVIMSY